MTVRSKPESVFEITGIRRKVNYAKFDDLLADSKNIVGKKK